MFDQQAQEARGAGNARWISFVVELAGKINALGPPKTFSHCLSNCPLGMKFLLFTLVLFMMSQIAFSQNYIYRGNAKYPSTPSYDFSCSACPMGGGTLEVAFAKSSTGGYMLLSTSTPFSSMRIGGTVLIFLADASVITCTDKGIKDRVDGNSKVLYYLTSDEMAAISETNITKIRFAIRDSNMSSSESLTAANSRPYGIDEELQYNIPEDVAALYE